jgi:hypothetical protein
MSISFKQTRRAATGGRGQQCAVDRTAARVGAHAVAL